MLHQSSNRYWFLILMFGGCCLPSCRPADMVEPEEPVLTASQSSVDKVCALVSELLVIERSEVTAQTTLSDLGCDELDFVEIVMEIEDNFGIAIPDESVERLTGTREWNTGLQNVTMLKLANLAESLMK